MIEVRIKPDDIVRARTQDLMTWQIMDKLREAGIPVTGRTIFQGVDYGVLTRFDDKQTGDIVFTWEPDHEQRVVRWSEDVLPPQEGTLVKWAVALLVIVAVFSAAYSVLG